MHYHLVGIRGISMRGVGVILEKLGHQVSGSDIKTGGHNSKNITSDIDFVVYSSAITPKSQGWIEIETAKKKNIPIVKRSELISKLASDKFLITVSGMHGKTTTTAMIGLILVDAGLDPTILVGEEIPDFDNSVVRVGKSKYWVLEACEYDRSFLDFEPNIAVITNIDFEHPDTFPGGIEEVKRAFAKFIKNIKQSGSLIYYSSDKNLNQIVDKVRKDIKIISYGNIDHNNIKLNLIGKYNQLNAQAAVAVAKDLNIDSKKIYESLSKFKGAKRRLQYIGKYKSMMVYDDYGHHPTEIAATINALSKKYPTKKIMVVFWPHQYRRIKPLVNEFSKSFHLADKVILKPIFFVEGRDDRLNVSSEDLSKLINKRGVDCRVIKSDDKIITKIKKEADNNTILLTIGAPPINKIAEEVIKNEK